MVTYFRHLLGEGRAIRFQMFDNVLFYNVVLTSIVTHTKNKRVSKGTSAPMSTFASKRGVCRLDMKITGCDTFSSYLWALVVKKKSYPVHLDTHTTQPTNYLFDRIWGSVSLSLSGAATLCTDFGQNRGAHKGKLRQPAREKIGHP